MIRKYLICPQRRRYVPRQFSWVDHRLVRHRYICRCSTEALALYLFLITVSDADGLSYYADPSVCKYLNMRPKVLLKARHELITADLIAYDEPIYQILALDRQPMPVSLSASPKYDDGNDDNDDPPLTTAPVKSPITPIPGGEPNRLKQTAHIGAIINTIMGKDLS
jgi:hypothetical protein